jgi:hypothetical protein
LTAQTTAQASLRRFPDREATAEICHVAAFLLAAFLFYRHAKKQVVVFHHFDFGFLRAS